MRKPGRSRSTFVVDVKKRITAMLVYQGANSGYLMKFQIRFGKGHFGHDSTNPIPITKIS
jgi:hypothetical protein